MSTERLGRIELETGRVDLAVKCGEMKIALLGMTDELAAMNEKIDAGFARVEAMIRSRIDTRGGIDKGLSKKAAPRQRRNAPLGHRRKAR